MRYINHKDQCTFDSFTALHRLCLLFQFFNKSSYRFVNPFLDGHRVGSRSHIKEAHFDQFSCKNTSSCCSITCRVICPAGHLNSPEGHAHKTRAFNTRLQVPINLLKVRSSLQESEEQKIESALKLATILTSLIRAAPAFSIALGNSMARAIVTPSLITLGVPNSSRTTLRPANPQHSALVQVTSSHT